MLRPATPLTVLLFCAFVLLLLSLLSTPVIKGIPLARYQDTSFGIFGYCSDSKGCSGIKVGYSTDGLFQGTAADGDFNLPSGARHSLFSLLIVHPIAAFFCLIMTILAAAAHFHSPSHSPRYLLALLILTLPTLLITLLAFLVDVLLFIPHLAWGGWIVLGSVILIVASGIMLCAMRRTLVSKKARKKRIAENAEMSGENFYNRQREEDKMASIPIMTTESKTPLMNGYAGADTMSNSGTYFAGRPSDERHPPRSVHTPVSPIDEQNRYYTTPSRSSSRPRPEIPPMPAAMPVAMPNDRYIPSPVQAEETQVHEDRPMNYPPNSYGRGRGYGPPRGRGGPPPGFRGGYGPPSRGAYRGPPGPPPNSRGNFGPDMRGGHQGYGRGGSSIGPMIAGGAGAAIMAGAMSRRPPPEYPPPGQQGSLANNTQFSQAATHYEPHSPSDYGTPRASTAYPAYDGQAQSSGGDKSSPGENRWQHEDDLPRAETPPPDLGPIGNAIEMDATTGRASGYDPTGHDTTVHDIVSLPRNQDVGGPRRSQEQASYAPPRQDWGAGNAMNIAPPTPPQNRARGTSVISNTSNSRYYEDVDPRFAEPEPLPSVPVQQQQQQQQPPQNRNLQPPHVHLTNHSPELGVPLPHTNSFDHLPAGARSPAISEQSEFTSISQRPVNPNWRPGHGGEFNQFGPAPSARTDRSQVRQDMILANNPDFELPGMGPPVSRGMRPVGRGGMRGAPMGMGGVQRVPLPPSALSLGGDGRYPEPVVPSGIATVRDV